MCPDSISRGGLVLVTDLHRAGYDPRQVQRQAARGALRRLARGAYVDYQDWVTASARDRHILRMRAIDATRARTLVFSHASAAALHGLPVLGAWPVVTHVSSDVPGRSKNGVAYHQALPERSPIILHGLTCTSLADTLVDLAHTASFTSATISIDHALHRAAVDALPHGKRIVAESVDATDAAVAAKSRLLEAFHRFAPARGFRRRLLPLEFATHLADSPGESLSRCGIHLLGFPPPELQHRFDDYDGRIGYGDFWWEHSRLLGEFDGVDKYKNPTFLAGRTPEQALLDEKWREDRIRATNAGVSRWGWGTALDLQKLYNKLYSAGLRSVTHRSPVR